MARAREPISTARMVRWLGFILEKVVDIKSTVIKKPSAGQSGLLQLTIYAFWDVEDMAGRLMDPFLKRPLSGVQGLANTRVLGI